MRMKSLLFSILFCLITFSLQANEFAGVWAALEKNDRQFARELLNEALQKETTKVEASLILMFLNTFEFQDGNLAIAKQLFPNLKFPNPYLFALWYEDGFLDGQHKKEAEREQFLLKILNSNRLNPTVHGSLQYMLGFNYGLGNDMKKAEDYWKQIKSISDWQIVGSFNNTEGSGFDKGYAPIHSLEPSNEFRAANNAPIEWFVPEHTDNQPWIGTNYYITESTGILYAQSFFDTEEEKELLFATGFAGNIKIWINDVLILSEAEELRTDMDYLKAKVRIPKGSNRILVQQGYTNKKTSYPNFILRAFDKDEELIDLQSTSQYRSYNKGEATLVDKDFPHFAEQFFRDKIEKEPKHILNHLLLAKTYYRSNKFNQAIKLLEEALEYYPENILIHYELLINYDAVGDRTKISKQVEALRKIDKDACFFAVFDYEIDVEKKDIPTLKKYVDKMIDCIGADSEDYYHYYINWLTLKNDLQKIIEVAEEAYNKYPINETFLRYKFNILNNVQQKPEKAIKILEDYLINNYSYQLNLLLKEEYNKQKKTKEVETLLLKLHQLYPNHIEIYNQLISYYYKTQAYQKTLDFIDKGLKNAPYRSSYWSDRAYVNNALGNHTEAINDLKKAITYNPNAFDVRDRLDILVGKTPIKEFIKDKDRTTTILKKLDSEISYSGEADYEYLFYDKSIVLYPEGPYSKYYSTAWQIQNEAGINKWKESHIPYDSRNNRLTFEKAEVYKKNGEKLMAERNNNEFVFTSLEIGDIIFVEYRLDVIRGGILAKEFWETNSLNDFVPIAESRYRIFADPDYSLYFHYNNFEYAPIKNTFGDFVCYDWTLTDLAAIKTEGYMPTLTETGKTLSISSLDSWEKIANWYQDLALPQAKEDYNLQTIYDEIFAKQQHFTDREKANAIYEYIAKNVQYSSVSFRQSGYVPQKPMVTISTRLGDCKDVATLYHTLANKANLKTNLVLVSTRDNGTKSILQPSIDFNHCIIKIDLPEGTLFQELTDNKLPFGAIPNSVQHAQALVIPRKGEKMKNSSLINIPNQPLFANTLTRKTSAQIEGDQLKMKTKLSVMGQPASNYRDYFAGLSSEKLKEQITDLFNKYFDKSLTIHQYAIENLDNLNPELQLETNFDVHKSVLSIGGINAIQIPYMEQIFLPDDFSKENRTEPFVYWKYENYDRYTVEIDLELPKNSQIVEIPKGVSVKNDVIDYSLSIEKINERKLKIVRSVKFNRKTIQPEAYKKFRKTVQQILEMEDAYIAYK